MRLTENQLRRIIRSVIKENNINLAWELAGEIESIKTNNPGPIKNMVSRHKTNHNTCPEADRLLKALEKKGLFKGRSLNQNQIFSVVQKWQVAVGEEHTQMCLDNIKSYK